MNRAERDDKQRRIHLALHTGSLATCPDDRCRRIALTGSEVHHKDGDPRNNAIDNLELVPRPDEDRG